jgi:hypothetical protein
VMEDPDPGPALRHDGHGKPWPGRRGQVCSRFPSANAGVIGVPSRSSPDASSAQSARIGCQTTRRIGCERLPHGPLTFRAPRL